MNKYIALREEHPRFIYHDVEIGSGYFSFHFSIDEHHFYPKWSYDENLVPKDESYFRLLVFNLGMTELVSYWKCACCPIVEIRCGTLDKYQVEWWKKLYLNGLQEFFYRNGIQPSDDIMDIICVDNEKPEFSPQTDFIGCLIPVGGGKDSVVTMELLGKTIADNLCYMINPRRAALETARLAGFSDEQIISVKRTISPKLLELNAKGYLNGHTPFSAIVAFSSYIFAYLTGRKYIVLSNESSANESNVSGTEINHQYSKSTEFERDFRQYAAYSFGEQPEYFSLLRPWSEWQIAKRFVSYKKYNAVFQSCNVGTKTDTWCGECAKCLYVYIMLAAFLQDDELVEIFGTNMLERSELSAIFDGLVYDSFDKPFECVGTREEINLALKTAYSIRMSKEKMPLLLQQYIDKNGDVIDKGLDDFYDENNFLPDYFERIIKQDA